MRQLVLFLSFGMPLVAQTKLAAPMGGTVDASTATLTRPDRQGAGSPNARDNCVKVGESYFQTDAVAGSNSWKCTTIGTPGIWTLQGSAGSGSGSVVLTSGAGAPVAACTAPSSSNLAVYLDSTNQDEWWCSTTNTWKKVLSVSGSGPWGSSGATGTAPATPAAGSLACYYDSTSNTQICIDSSGNAFTMVKGIAAPTNQFVRYTDALGIQHPASIVFADLPTGTTSTTVPPGNDARFSDARTPVAPTSSTLGGTKSIDCTGTGHLLKIDTTGTPTCSADSGGGSSGVGRSSLAATFTAIPDGGIQEQTVTWTGVLTTDTVVLGSPSGLPTGLLASARVSATNTVAIRLLNLSGAAVTPGVQTFAGTLAIYNLSGAGTIDFAAIPDGACLSNTFTLTGTAAGDPIAAKWPSTLEAGLSGSMLGSATDTVQVRLCNFSGASVNPASQSFGASVAK